MKLLVALTIIISFYSKIALSETDAPIKNLGINGQGKVVAGMKQEGVLLFVLFDTNNSCKSEITISIASKRPSTPNRFIDINWALATDIDKWRYSKGLARRGGGYNHVTVNAPEKLIEQMKSTHEFKLVVDDEPLFGFKMKNSRKAVTGAQKQCAESLKS